MTCWLVTVVKDFPYHAFHVYMYKCSLCHCWCVCVHGLRVSLVVCPRVIHVAKMAFNCFPVPAKQSALLLFWCNFTRASTWTSIRLPPSPPPPPPKKKKKKKKIKKEKEKEKRILDSLHTRTGRKTTTQKQTRNSSRTCYNVIETNEEHFAEDIMLRPNDTKWVTVNSDRSQVVRHYKKSTHFTWSLPFAPANLANVEQIQPPSLLFFLSFFY